MATSGQLIDYATLASDTALWNDTGNLENPGSSGKSFLSIAPFQYFYISTGSKPLVGAEPKVQLLVNASTWKNPSRAEGYNWIQLNDVTIGKSTEQVHQTNKSGGYASYSVGPGIVLWRPKRLQGADDRTHFRFANGGLANCGETYYYTWWKNQPIYGFISSYIYLGDTWAVDTPSHYLQTSSGGFGRIPSGTPIEAQYARCVYPPMPWM